ncbi:iron ABC transporter permease [Pikeienuella sp. HZG-20]|uniref:ABC transporter permease n=1 Tax=Paludibacillus litoralis TaxID=3133267 RepID=UPI0030EE5345
MAIQLSDDQALRASRPRPVRLRSGPSWIGVAAVLVTVFSLIPLGFIVWAGFQSGWGTITELLFRERVAGLLFNTLVLIGLTIPIAATLSVGLAWLTERSDLPGARFWAWLAVAPLAVPAFVHSYAWITLIPGLNGLSAGVLISVIAYFPFIYLPVAATMRRLDPALEDAAASLGDAPGRVFLRVVLPQLRLALLGGALLVALHLLTEYGLFVFIRFDTFTTAIVDQFQTSFNGPAANALSGGLVACCLAVVGLDILLRGSERYARVGSGAAREPERFRLGRAALPCMAIPLVVALITLGVPFMTIGRWLAKGGASIWEFAEIGRALWQTTGLAVVGGFLAVVFAVPMSWLSIRRPGPLPRLLEACNYIIGALPGVVIALAFVSVTVRVAPFLYQSVATILAAYAVMFLPRALISLRPSLAQAPVELEQAAGALGRTPLQALMQITVRLSAPGAAVGAALAGIGIMTELTATQMLAPNGTRTLALAFWAKSGELDYAAAAPYALIMVAVSLPLTWILFVQSRRMAGR